MSACAIRVSANVFGPGAGGTHVVPPDAQVSASVYGPPERCNQLDATIRYSPVVGSVNDRIADGERVGDRSTERDGALGHEIARKVCLASQGERRRLFFLSVRNLRVTSA